MFETSVVRGQAVAAPRRAGLLTVSLALHSIAGAAIVVASIGSVSFPNETPDQYELFRPMQPISIPAPLGTPDGGGGPRPQPRAAVPPPQQPRVETAPTAPQEIPAEIPELPQATSTGDATTLSSSPSDLPGSGPGPGTGGTRGLPSGVPNAVDIGQPLVPSGPSADAGPRMPGGEVKSATVVRRVDPRYPDLAARTRMAGVVKVLCIIDRNGNIRDPQVTFSSFEPFNAPVLAAVQQWKFRPGTLHGQPIDTYFELTVTFTPR